jgi:hypothetical protein
MAERRFPPSWPLAHSPHPAWAMLGPKSTICDIRHFAPGELALWCSYSGQEGHNVCSNQKDERAFYPLV